MSTEAGQTCSCGAESPRTAKFCMECGTPFVRCPGCGEEVPDQAKFCPQCGASQTLDASDREGERRHLTVLFADLADSTVMADRLDPEDMRDVLRAFQQHCGEVVASRGGHVARYMGDGVLIYFGYPRAEPDSAEKAVAASLEITAGAAGLSEVLDGVGGIELSARVGIHAGTVFVGEMGHGDRLEAADVVGDTPNIAARLQSLARPGDVVMSAGVRAVVHGRFEVESLGERELKGISHPVEVFRALREIDPAASASLPMIGRDEERSIVAEQWQSVRDGNVEVVLVAGEPGVGKSRLMESILETLRTEANPVELQCAEHHDHSAFAPVVRLLRTQLGLVVDATDVAVVEALADGCRDRDLPPEEIVPFLATVLGVDPAPRFDMPEISAEGRRVKMIEAVARWLRASAGPGRVVVVVDDLHWVDSSTAEVLERLRVDLADDGGLLFLTSRRNSLPDAIRPVRSTSILLQRLDADDAQQVLSSVVGAEVLNEEEVAAIVRASEGIPLYIEQFARGVAESREVSGFAAIPITLQDSLMARLDRLGDARVIAQTASILGREFVQSVLELMAPELRSVSAGLESLVAAGVLQRTDSHYGPRFRFSHSLMELAAYESMLRSRRVALHRRAVDAIAEAFPDLPEREPEVLARHHELAGDFAHAVDLLKLAAHRYSSAYSMDEAGALAGRALELLEEMDETDARNRLQMDLLAVQVTALQAVRGYADPAAVPVQEAYLAAAVRLDDQVSATIANLYIASRHMSAGRSRESLAAAEAMIEGSDKLGIPYLRLATRSVQAGCRAMAADYTGTVEAASAGLDALDDIDHPFPEGTVNPAYLCSSSMGLGLWSMGHLDEAVRISDEGVEFRFDGKPPDPQGIGVALVYRGWVHLLNNDYEKAREDCRLAMEVGNTQGVAWLRWASRVFEAIASSQLDPSPEADRLLEASVEEYPHSGPTVKWHGHAQLALALHRRGESDAALARLAELRVAAAELGGGFCEEELVRSQVWLHATRGSYQLARELHEEGQAMAAERAAPAWSLRLGLALAAAPDLADEARVWVAKARGELLGSGTTGLEQEADRFLAQR